VSRIVRVVVVDDEPLARQRIRRLLRREPDVRIVGECADGSEAVATILREDPDLLFLDVQMPELDGFGVLRALPVERLPVTVDVTAFDQYALQAFDAQALDYLLKPFTEARFRTAFERARAAVGGAEPADRVRLLALLDQMRGAQRELRELVEATNPAATDRLLVREKGRIRIVVAEEVDYFEAARNHVRLHVGRSTHLLRESLGALERRLDPARFARIHRSTVVNLDRIAEIQPWFSGDAMLVLRDGAKLRLSRAYRQELESRLSRGLRTRGLPLG
jgi:two-component system LytT family response regulator